MVDAHERGTARAPAILGEGCTRRYDPEAMGEDCGSEFPGAAELWQQVQPLPLEEALPRERQAVTAKES